MRLGAIDVGTNSIHLIVVELDPRFGTSRTILRAREMLRLGGGGALAQGRLSKRAVRRGVEAIAKFAEAARAAGALDIRAVATSAVRESANGTEFAAAVRAASGVPVEVLDEAEEARLIHLGVSRGFPIGNRTALIFDIGGGSTEFIVGDAHHAFFLHSVRLGSLRLFDEFLGDATARSNYRALETRVREALAPLAQPLHDYRFDLVVGTSGTVLGLAALDAAATNPAGGRAHGYVLRLERLRALQDAMRAMTPEERRKMPGMNPRRSDIIVAGNAIVIGILEMLRRDALVVCERALRDGIVVDYLERNLSLTRKIGDERARRFAVLDRLGERLDGGDSVHRRRVAALALELFDGLAEIHGFEPADRDLLFGAALVHDVGRVIAESAHHKHGAYVLRNARLDGWSAEEREMLAVLVRYHRKSPPKPSHSEWAGADAAARKKIEGLAGMLRIADGLDRRRLGIVNALEVRIERPVVTVRARAAQDVGEELAAAASKAEMFERAYNLQFAFEAAPADRYEASFDSERSADEIEAASFSA